MPIFCVYITDCYRIVCAYLLMLVRWGLFDKVELHFGLKGHTHDGRLPRSVLSVLTAVPKHMLAFGSNVLWVTCFVVCIYLLFSSNARKLDSQIYLICRAYLPPSASRSAWLTSCYAWRSNIFDACQFGALLYLQRSTRSSQGEWFHL